MSLVENREISSAQAGFRISEASAGDFFALLKPRVMSLVVFTAFAGLVLAPGSIHPVMGLFAIICIAVGAGASGALNMWYDADIDAVMARTATRPIPAGKTAQRRNSPRSAATSAVSSAGRDNIRLNKGPTYGMSMPAFDRTCPHHHDNFPAEQGYRSPFP